MNLGDLEALRGRHGVHCYSLGDVYDGETHAGLFHLPKYLRRALAEETRVITEENPVFVF